MTGAEKTQTGEVGQQQLSETDSFLPVPKKQNGTRPLELEEVPDDVTSYSLWRRLEADGPFRRRFVHTAWLLWAFIGLGWMVGQVGPSFPDLRFIIQKDLDTATWFFTVGSFGYLVGSLIGGILYDNFNKLLLIVFSILIMAAATAAIPWCSSFPLMLAMSLIRGLGSGGLDTGGNADLVSLWDEEGRPYMQALHFCFGFGGIISPLVTEPFLAEKSCVSIPENTTDNYIQPTPSFKPVSEQSTIPSRTWPCQDVFHATYIQYAYLITSILIVTSALPFLALYVRGKRLSQKQTLQANKNNKTRPKKLPLPMRAMFLVLLPTMMMLYSSVEDTFGSFLMTFCLRHLHWTKEQGSYATSLHWAAFSVGRLLGIFIVRSVKPVQLLSAFYTFLCCSFIGFFIASVTLTEALIWLFVPLAGFSMSVIFPCIFTWTEESILEVTGRITSLFLISSSTGLLLNPLLLGYLMDNIDPVSFAYLLLVESFLALFTFLIILFLVKKYVEPRVEVDSRREIEMQVVNVSASTT